MWRKDEPQAPSLPAQTKSTPATSLSPSAGFDRAKSATLPSTATVEGRFTRSLIVEGEITGRDDLLIDCQVRGEIRLHGGKLTVGPDGRVSADIEAREVVVRGEVTGSIKGHERVLIAATGKVRGEISTGSISIEEGAEVHGLRVNLEKEGHARSAAVVATDSRPAGKPQVPVAAEPSQVHL
jgi:cytoskeletal protein CcmA (bactofilin family)